jgi:hypothetical protein
MFFTAGMSPGGSVDMVPGATIAVSLQTVFARKSDLTAVICRTSGSASLPTEGMIFRLFPRA